MRDKNAQIVLLADCQHFFRTVPVEISDLEFDQQFCCNSRISHRPRIQLILRILCNGSLTKSGLADRAESACQIKNSRRSLAVAFDFMRFGFRLHSRIVAPRQTVFADDDRKTFADGFPF